MLLRLLAALPLAAAVSLLPVTAFADPPPKAAATVDARKLGDAFADVAERVSPSVVQIDVTTGDGGSQLRVFKSDNVQHGLGSGVIFLADGAILTNNHVIESARTITVRLRDGRMFPARVAGRDPSTDLAVLRIDAKNLTPATFGDSDAARVGEWVIAIGSPFGFGHTVTTGVLSAKGRGGVGINAVEDYLQTDASINPGNSGGPLVNLDGRVLGINTMIVSRGQGIGLAVPSSLARRVAEQILRIGRVDRAFIGLGLQDLTPAIAAELPTAPQDGALVRRRAAERPRREGEARAGRHRRRLRRQARARRAGPHPRGVRAHGRRDVAHRLRARRAARARQRDARLTPRGRAAAAAARAHAGPRSRASASRCATSRPAPRAPRSPSSPASRRTRRPIAPG